MTNVYQIATQSFVSIIDFLRFGVSMAYKNNLYYGHGTDNAWDDIWSLILRSLDLPYDVDPIVLQARLTSDEKTYLCQQLERRIIDRVPVPYLINEAYFAEQLFYVDSRVLIPRSPLAEVIQQQFMPWIDPDRVVRILDLCTGSGCIAVACCYAFMDAVVDGVDISTDALQVAERNVTQHDLHARLKLIESNLFSAVSEKKYDIIVSNPPYVGAIEMQTLPAEYLHEPRMALETGNNGLEIVDMILKQAANYLSAAGILVVEVGNSQEELMEAYPTIPFTWIDFSHGGQGVFLLTREQLESFL